MMEPITKAALRLYTTERIPEQVQNAFLVALSGQPGPVYLDLPADVLFREVTADAIQWPNVRSVDFAQSARPGAARRRGRAVAQRAAADRAVRHRRAACRGWRCAAASSSRRPGCRCSRRRRVAASSRKTDGPHAGHRAQQRVQGGGPYSRGRHAAQLHLRLRETAALCARTPRSSTSTSIRSNSRAIPRRRAPAGRRGGRAERAHAARSRRLAAAPTSAWLTTLHDERRAQAGERRASSNSRSTRRRSIRCGCAPRSRRCCPRTRCSRSTAT